MTQLEEQRTSSVPKHVLRCHQFPPAVGPASGLRGEVDQQVPVHSTQPAWYGKELQKQEHCEQVTAKTKTKTRANSNSLHESVDIGLALSINP